MKLYLIRHGESVGNTKRGFLSGRTDLGGLTTTGRAQIIRRAWELRTMGISHIVSSPVVRARESAQILSHLLGVPYVKKTIMIELDHGDFEGHYWWEMKDRLKDMKTGPWDDFHTPYPNGESFQDLSIRVQHGIQWMLATYDDSETIAVVTHDAIVATMIYLFNNNLEIRDPKSYRTFLHSFSVANAGCWEVTCSENQYTVAESPALKQVAISTESVLFYVRGMELLDDSDVEPVKSVSSNENFIAREKKRHVLVKILHDQEVLSGQRLVDLYTYLHKHTRIAAPAVLRYDQSGAVYSSDVLLQDFLDGETLDGCITGHADGLAQLLRALRLQLSAIHRIPVADVYSFWYPNDWNRLAQATWERFMLFEMGKTMKELHNVSGLSRETFIMLAEEMGKLERYLTHGNYKQVPLHGDVLPANIIVDHTKGDCTLARIIDFERARIGDSVWDYVYFYGFVERKNAQLAQAWKAEIFPKFTSIQREAFMLYNTLFHAWTVRDMIDYSGVKTRNRRGLESLAILEKKAQNG